MTVRYKVIAPYFDGVYHDEDKHNTITRDEPFPDGECSKALELIDGKPAAKKKASKKADAKD